MNILYKHLFLSPNKCIVNMADYSAQTRSLIDLVKYNGRINIIQPPDMSIQMKMTEKIMIANKSTDHRDNVYEDNMLGNVFFSAGNIQIIQNGIRAGVYEKSNGLYVIPNQNINNLKVIMRSTYLQYAEHKPDNITAQVERLNQIVLDYCVPSVYSEAVGYERYCQDQSSLIVPLEQPRNHDRNYRQLEMKPWV
jgi:hypothetical protein